MGGPRLVQWSRFSDAYQRLFGLQGSTALNVVDDVFLTLPAELEGLHLSHLRGWHPFARGLAVNAVAAQFGRIRLKNPPTSGSLVLIQGFSMYPPANAQFQTGLATNVAGPAGTETYSRDSRDGIGAAFVQPIGIVAENSAGLLASGPTGYFNGVAGFPSPFYEYQHVVAPGTDFVLECLNVNQAFTGFVFGQLREMTAQET